MTRIRTLAIFLVPLVLASGCGIFKTEEQKLAERAREKPLEVPPDLTSPAFDQRYALIKKGIALRSQQPVVDQSDDR